MPAARIEENLLFGVLAFQRRMIAEEQFVQAAVLWSLRFESSIAEILIQQRHLTDFDRRDIDRDVARILQKHRGDARESVRWVANPETQALLSRLDQSDVRRSVSGLNPATHPEKAAAVRTIPPDSIESLASSRYSLIREYAEGGLGKIFLARDASLHRQVALKELKSEKWSDDEHRRRFLKEAQITGQLEHPNIVPVYELARRPEDDQPYYTMRFIEGRTLGDAIADHHAHRQSDGRDDPLEFRRLLDAFVSVCNAVA